MRSFFVFMHFVGFNRKANVYAKYAKVFLSDTPSLSFRRRRNLRKKLYKDWRHSIRSYLWRFLVPRNELCGDWNLEF